MDAVKDFSLREFVRLVLAVVVTSAILLIVTPATVHADGVTRAPLNSTETARRLLCWDNSNPGNASISKFGAVWINDTPTSNTTNARWDENMTVSWNATSVSATMWTTAFNCPVSERGKAFSGAKIVGLAPATGGTVPVSFTSGTQIIRGTGTTYPNQWTNPPGALRVTLNVTGKATGCYSVRYSGQYYDNFGYGIRSTYSTRVCITRQAAPPATLDGYKIDDAGYDATTRPTGGNLGAAYNNQTVAVSGSGSDSRNPFYFTGASGGGGTIAIGSSGVTTHTISIALPTPVSGYKLVGYSICYSGQSNCTSAGLAYKATGYYKSIASGTNSISYSFAAGRAYHMRWIFQSTVGITCGDFSTTPQKIDGQSRFSSNTTVNFSGVYAPVSPTVRLTLSPAVNFNGNSAVVVPAMTTVGAQTIATATHGTNALQLGPTNATGIYTATWTYDDATLAVPKVCTDTFTVANMPYVAVYGGDIVVGNSPTIETSCYTNVDGGAYSWNNYATNFRGAGAQYAVMALGTIQEFASSLGTTTPDKLAFANVDYGPADPAHDVTSGLYGGMFGASNTPCDFLSDVQGTYPLENGPGPVSAYFNSAATQAVSGQVVKYAEGDVFISKNVVYSGVAWANLSAIPSLKLVVRGDIYIDGSVTQLDGLYVALSTDDGTAGGNIFTCSNSPGDDIKPSLPNYYDRCHTKLTVNGAFVAKQIHLLRTMGTIGQSNTDTPTANNAAEVFNYSPELWLPRNASLGTGRYMSITGLPPIL